MITAFLSWLKRIFGIKDTYAPAVPVSEPVVLVPIDPATFFDAAFEYTMVNEGGYSDVPDDRGGKTNYGIIESEYARWLGRPVTEADMRNLTKTVAKQIYFKWYWSPLHIERITAKNVAIALFDRAVLNGLTGCSRHVRVVLGYEEKSNGDSANFDGLIAAVNKMDPITFVMKLADRCEAKHRRVVELDRSQARFLKGWLNRVNRMRRELGNG